MELLSKPKKCPKCGKPLTAVQLERTTIVEWDEDEKEFYDNGQGTGTARCYNCGKAIGGYGQGNWGYWVEIE